MWIKSVVFLGLMAGSGWAQSPMSAIDWLSDTAAAPETPAVSAGPDVTTSAAVGDVSVSTLDGPGVGAVGVLSSAATGLPETLWVGTPITRIQALFSTLQPSRLAAINDLVVTLMLAEAGPGAKADGEPLLLARVDLLLSRGALEPAAALLDQAGTGDAARFRRAFDVALLTGAEDRACNTLRQSPGVRPTYPARIFCLARTGDWNAAALTLDAARALGQVNTDDDTLLASFLDPELADHLAVPRGMTPSPLTFRMLDAIGEPLPTGPLPLAFAQSDLRSSIGWKAQLEAAERLARVGAISPARLIDLFTRRAPSASGGIWDRVAAVQALEKALHDKDAGAVAQTLAPAYEEMRAEGLEVPFAVAVGPKLQDVTLSGPASELAYRITLLTSDYEAATRRHTHDPASKRDDFLTGLARGLPDGTPPYDQMSAAVAQAFAGAPPPRELGDLARKGRLGEAILMATKMVDAGISGDFKQLTAGLAFLRSVGLEDVSRRAGLQALILAPKGG